MQIVIDFDTHPVFSKVASLCCAHQKTTFSIALQQIKNYCSKSFMQDNTKDTGYYLCGIELAVKNSF